MAETDSVPAASAALVRELSRVQRLHAERTGNPILAGSLERVAYWQARRLRMTYADLAADARYAPAIAFFQNDLYGPGDFSRRDADLARVVPMMVKVLPERVIMTVAAAMDLNALSQELDRVLLSRLPRADGHFNVLGILQGLSPRGQFPAAQAADQADRRNRYGARPARRQAAGAHGARDDAATGEARRTVGAAGLPRARLRGVPPHGRRGRVPAHDRDARNADHGGDHRRRDGSIPGSAAVRPRVAVAGAPR